MLTLILTAALSLTLPPALPAYNAVPGMDTHATAVLTLSGTGHHGHLEGALARFNMPLALTVLPDGRLVVFDTHNNLIRLVDMDGYTTRLTGSVTGYDDFGFPRGFHLDGPAADALFNRPAHGIFHDGMLYIVDSASNAIRVVMFCETTDAVQNVYTLVGSTGRGHRDGPVRQAQLNHPAAIAPGPCGSIFIADTLNHVVRRVDDQGDVTTVAGIPGVHGFADGAAGEAVFFSPMGIVVCPQGIIYVADTGNHLIRKIEDGVVTTLAGTYTLDAADDSDGFFEPDEPIGFFADGFHAAFSLPTGLTMWRDLLIVADSANHRIRGVLPTGEVVTLAGDGTPGYRAANAMDAQFQMPRGVFVLENTLFVADTNNNLIRMLPLVFE